MSEAASRLGGMVFDAILCVGGIASALSDSTAGAIFFGVVLASRVLSEPREVRLPKVINVVVKTHDSETP